MALFETKFFAISQLTGLMCEYRGSFIEAENMIDATTIMRRDGLDYYVLTGRTYKDVEAIEREAHFFEVLDEETIKFKAMGLNEFIDWVSSAQTVEELEMALERVIDEGLEEFVPLIAKQIEKYEKRDAQQKGDGDND